MTERDHPRAAPARRRFLKSTAAAGLLGGLDALVPAWAWRGTGTLLAERRIDGDADVYDLEIARTPVTIGGRRAEPITLNGSIPGPAIRLREGREAVLRVTNRLEEDTSIHWHGILLPYRMDGVPGVSFPGIRPGETFEYRYPVRQSGTYWYHSHSGLQEQFGHYGPLIVEPSEPEPFAYDREHVVMLSDWTFDDPHHVLANLKKAEGYYNYNKRTVGDFFHDVATEGWAAAWNKSAMWGRMRMSPRDLLDVTGAEYTYLVNGIAPEPGWTGLFRPGERVRLRIINGSAMSIFDVRIPGLAMTVVQADGQNVRPVTVDELRIGVAETYDVVVEPTADRAWTVFAEAMDRSGYARGTLAPREGMTAPVPELREPPERGMAAMGMKMAHMSDGGMHGMEESGAGGEGHGAMAMSGMKTDAGSGGHGPDHHGPGAAMVAMNPRSRLDDPGVGLTDVAHRVLVYADLRGLDHWPDRREPSREVELHLTGNMERYMWSFDGEKFSEVDGPIPFHHGERLRLTLVNDTMMDHPIHLHGMWMELDTGPGTYRPRKHTILVKPGERVSALITADAPGDWAFHCHLLYHMKAGMFRVVRVA